MDELIKKTKNKIFYICPETIKYCIYPSKYCDYTHVGLSKLRPHAGKNRGVFKENLSGYIKIDKSNWDNKPGILFTKLLEYEALVNHYNGKENWKNSQFAKRNVNFIKLNNNIRGFTDPEVFLSEREKQIDKLFNSCLLYTSPSPRD